MRDRVRVMFDHALAECSILQAFSRKLQCQGRSLHSGSEVYDLGSFERILVVSIGKAGHSMAEAFGNIVGTALNGIIATPTAPPEQLAGFRYFIGGHPLPNDDSLRAGDAILRLLHALSPETLAVFLISGGASAIAEKPISDGITLADVVATYRALVLSGAPIAEINARRAGVGTDHARHHDRQRVLRNCRVLPVARPLSTAGALAVRWRAVARDAEGRRSCLRALALRHRAVERDRGQRGR
jgi:hydroxypyruvate reductase